MSEIRRLSLILNQNSKQSHNAFKKILNKFCSNDYGQVNISNSNNSEGIDLKPWIKNKNDNSRFDWQTNSLRQEFTNKINGKCRVSRCHSKDIKSIIDPKYYPLNNSPKHIVTGYKQAIKKTSSVISLKDKLKEEEPKIFPHKKYNLNYEKPGIYNLINKTPAEFPVYTKKKIIQVPAKPEQRNGLKINSKYNCTTSSLMGSAAMVQKTKFDDFDNSSLLLRKNHTSTDNIFSKEQNYKTELKQLDENKKKKVNFHRSTSVAEILANNKKVLKTANINNKRNDLLNKLTNKESIREENFFQGGRKTYNLNKNHSNFKLC